MTEGTVSTLLADVSKKVLFAIQDMSDKQKIKKPICLDSISLVLKIKLLDLAPIIAYLECKGHITIHPNLSLKTKMVKPDSISLN